MTTNEDGSSSVEGVARTTKRKEVGAASREACWKAKDAYFACLEYNRDRDPTLSCKELRQVFEQDCIPSWVAHFDKVKAQETLIAQRNAAYAAQRNAANKR